MIIIIGILAAIAIPMFLNQRQKAKDAGVKEGVHAIQIGVQSFAVDNNDVYPAPATGASVAVGSAPTVNTTSSAPWPDDPFAAAAGTAMVATARTAGNYDYAQATIDVAGDSYTLDGLRRRRRASSSRAALTLRSGIERDEGAGPASPRPLALRVKCVNRRPARDAAPAADRACRSGSSMSGNGRR